MYDGSWDGRRRLVLQGLSHYLGYHGHALGVEGGIY